MCDVFSRHEENNGSIPFSLLTFSHKIGQFFGKVAVAVAESHVTH